MTCYTTPQPWQHRWMCLGAPGSTKKGGGHSTRRHWPYTRPARPGSSFSAHHLEGGQVAGGLLWWTHTSFVFGFSSAGMSVRPMELQLTVIALPSQPACFRERASARTSMRALLVPVASPRLGPAHSGAAIKRPRDQPQQWVRQQLVVSPHHRPGTRSACESMHTETAPAARVPKRTAVGYRWWC